MKVCLHVVGAIAILMGAACAFRAPTVPPGSPGEGRWAPRASEPWQWVLDGPLDVGDPEDMIGGGGSQPTVYDIDGFDNPASTVAALHASGYHVVCYVSVGSVESYRPDAAFFPAAALGNSVDGWPDEKWLDIRRIDLLAPIMSTRFKMCADKGFDAVEPDLMDGFSNPTGFELTFEDQLRYNRWVADTVHGMGMSVLLKGDPEQAAELEPWFDFALNEECTQFDECGSYAPFIDNGKTVLHVDYIEGVETLDAFCPEAKAAGLNAQMKRLELDGWRRPCP
jgi:hypothetical protein